MSCSTCVIFVPLHIDMFVQHDIPIGQRAGLIAAEDLHAAEILDGGQLLDDHLLLRHTFGSLCQRDGDDHRQQFGGQAHRQRDGEEEGLQQPFR